MKFGNRTLVTESDEPPTLHIKMPEFNVGDKVEVMGEAFTFPIDSCEWTDFSWYSGEILTITSPTMGNPRTFTLSLPGLNETITTTEDKLRWPLRNPKLTADDKLDVGERVEVVSQIQVEDTGILEPESWTEAYVKQDMGDTLHVRYANIHWNNCSEWLIVAKSEVRRGESLISIKVRKWKYIRDKRNFMKDLQSFRISKGENPVKTRYMSNKPLDLFHFYRLVSGCGGLEKVSDMKGSMTRIFKILEIYSPQNTAGAAVLKKIYMEDLYLFECEYLEKEPQTPKQYDYFKRSRSGSKYPRIKSRVPLPMGIVRERKESVKQSRDSPLEKLIEMGFPRDRAQSALEVSSGNLNRATAFLLAAPDRLKSLKERGRSKRPRISYTSSEGEEGEMQSNKKEWPHVKNVRRKVTKQEEKESEKDDEEEDEEEDVDIEEDEKEEEVEIRKVDEEDEEDEEDDEEEDEEVEEEQYKMEVEEVEKVDQDKVEASPLPPPPPKTPIQQASSQMNTNAHTHNPNELSTKKKVIKLFGKEIEI